MRIVRNPGAHKLQWSGPTVHSSTVPQETLQSGFDLHSGLLHNDEVNLIVKSLNQTIVTGGDKFGHPLYS